jgi:hypothetical protein
MKFSNQLRTQKSLKEIKLFLHGKHLCKTRELTIIMTTICNQLKCLYSLDLDFEEEEEAINNDAQLERTKQALSQIQLKNTTVETVSIEDKIQKFDIFAACLKIFTNLKAIFLTLWPHFTLQITETLDPEKLKIVDEIHVFEYSPAEIPEDRKSFEDGIAKFLNENGKNLRKLVIGHPNWNSEENSSFQLSFEFCKNLIKNLPKLEELELFAIKENFKMFYQFLGECERKPEKIKLHGEKPQTDAKDPKRMKLEYLF